MNRMTLYVDKNSYIHHMDPLTKLLFVFISVAVTYILPIHAFVIIVTIVTYVLLAIGKVIWRVIPIIGVSIVLIVSIVIVQGLFHPENEEVLFSIWGASFYKEGLSYALLLTLRVVNMLGAFSVLILTTRADELMERLIKKGMSPKIGYIFLSVLQLIPQMRITMGKITDAQASRGMKTKGNLFIRMKAFIPLIGPVILNSLNDTRDRAIALEIRGFDRRGKKTFLNETRTYRYQRIIQWVLIIALIGSIVWRVIL